MVTRARGYTVNMSNRVTEEISSLPPRYQEIVHGLILRLERSPHTKGKAVRGSPGRRVISNGGFRAVFDVNEAGRSVAVIAITTPDPAIVGDAMSIWELPRFREMLAMPVGAHVELTREEAAAIVREGFASRPDLPPGDEYVKRIRPMWAGLAKRRRVG